MAKYLIRASYTQEGLKGLIKDGGSKRVRAVEEAMKSVGAKLESLYFALGEDDVYAIVDAPDIETASALSMATNASGAVHLKTTVLLTPQQVDAAVKKSVAYTPPGK
ncbi:MAG TPA: GYD domain-containing protein [Vicinamibacteria bacterium]|jgi:uncharacterized protein with GYD domain